MNVTTRRVSSRKWGLLWERPVDGNVAYGRPRQADRNFSKLSAAGDVVATIDNRRVAAGRLRLDAPASAFFFNRKTLVRVDLLFDFPIAAAELAASAETVKIRGRVLRVASAADLLRLKEIAVQKRSFAGDAQDIEFLEAHLRA